MEQTLSHLGERFDLAHGMRGIPELPRTPVLVEAFAQALTALY